MSVAAFQHMFDCECSIRKPKNALLCCIHATRAADASYRLVIFIAFEVFFCWNALNTAIFAIKGENHDFIP